MTDQEKIIDRVRKLMALATSSNEHEAAAAAAKAQELMLKHNLSAAALNTKEEENTRDWIDEKDGSSWRAQLANGIARGLMCRIVVHNLGGKHKRYAVLGKPANVEVVQYMYEYLSKELVRLSPKPVHSAASHAFRVGAVSVLGQRMRETFTEFKEASAETRELVVVQDASVEAFKSSLYEDSLKKGSSGRISDGRAYHEGQQAGMAIPLRKGVQERNSGGQFLLG